MLLFGLTFTVAGTVLGGLWADQAWGRFWGWDPKENGALLIVLWCSAVIHARRGTMIGAVGTAVGSIVLFVLVLFAWLGVNLLGVGMHSYGFTTRGATVLFGVAGSELLLLAIAGGLLWFRRVRAHE
jgi:ABC-type transport system involved in cytochrome c biogenesis permease subunit